MNSISAERKIELDTLLVSVFTDYITMYEEAEKYELCAVLLTGKNDAEQRLSLSKQGNQTNT